MYYSLGSIFIKNTAVMLFRRDEGDRLVSWAELDILSALGDKDPKRGCICHEAKDGGVG